MNTIMVIPGAKAQIPFIKRLKKLGYKVVCVNPYEDSPAFLYADYCEQYDILDVEACLEVARKYKVIAVMSDECDIAMPTVAAISEKLRLPAMSVQMASLYTNKTKMRVFSQKNGFPYPKYLQTANVEEAKEFFHSLETKKMIIKPLDSNSSRGVYTIASEQELEKVFQNSLSFSHSLKVVLCEEFIEGTEFTIDGIVLNGKHYSLAVSKKSHYKHHPNIACELYFSNSDQEFDYEKLKNQNDAYVESTKLSVGFTHAEYKFNGKEFVLIEIGARGGGNYISSHIVPIMTGIDNYDFLLKETFHQEVLSYNPNQKFKERCAVLKFFDVDAKFDGCKVKSIKGEELLRNNKRVLLYEFNFKVGDVVSTADDDSKRIGFYIAYGDTKEELDTLMKKIEQDVLLQF